MKYREGFLAEVRRFERCQNQRADAAPNPIGLEQFFHYESRGIVPPAPDAYFQRLLNGKAWWEWTVNQYADSYGTSDWFGMDLIREDFKGDPSGLRQIQRRIEARHKVKASRLETVPIEYASEYSRDRAEASVAAMLELNPDMLACGV